MAFEMSLTRVGALALFLAVAPLAAPPLYAQPAPSAAVDPIEQRVFPPELVMGHADEIGLTAEQRDRIIAAVNGLQLQAATIMPHLAQGRALMVAELDSETADEARVLAALDNVLAAERDIKRLNIATLVRIRNVLTAAQRARLNALRPLAGR